MKKPAEKLDAVQQAVLNAFEIALDAQLRAIRRAKTREPVETARKKSTSQIDIVHDVLQRASEPLHISDILKRVEKLHGRRLDRESVVSSLAKKIARGERFERTGKNTFALKRGQS
jgi:hypothetical protein